MKRFFILITLFSLLLSSQQVSWAQTGKSPCVITKIGNPSISPVLPDSCLALATSENGDGSGILTWADKITQKLQKGGALWPDLYNRQQDDICNEAGVCAHKQSGNSTGDLFWCTYLVIDSFTLAGKKGLSVGSHGAVVNMAAFWRKTAGYTFLPYNSDDLSDPQNKVTLKSLRPGMPYFLYKFPDQTIDEEHTAIIKEIQIDQNGNGKYVTLESNSTGISHTFPIDNWVVKNHHHILRGFGGFEGSETAPVNSGPIKAALASLPGNAGGTVLYQDGQTVEQNGSKQLPSFSVIKLWVAATAYSLPLDLSETYTVTAADKADGTGVLNQRTLPTTVTLGELVRLMLVYSDNTATNILIKKLGGFGTVNFYISQNGYTQTKLQRYLGESNYTAANDNYSSANDAALFMKRLYAKQIVNASVSDSIIKILDDRSQNENKSYIYLGKNLPTSAELREKSGVGPNVRNDAGSFLTKDGKRVFVAIFQSELPSETAGEEAIANVAQTIYTTSTQ